MDTILVAVTTISLALAAAMGAMLMRTLRLERRRSDARVQLLEELAGTAPAAQRQRPRAEGSAGTRALDDFQFRPAAQATIAGPAIFEEHQEPSAWPRRFAVIGAMAAVIFAVVFGWGALGRSDVSPSTSTQATRQAPTTAPALELLSLQHAQQDGALVISGLVQNPRGSAPLPGVQATVILFAADGTTLATGRAPIDFTTLAPGDESSFVIRVPAAGAVSRYRVGFRGGDDRILAHVDRRNGDAIARKEAP